MIIKLEFPNSIALVLLMHNITDKMKNFFDLHEVDKNDVKLRILAQSLVGEVRKWSKNLAASSIADLIVFHQTFLNRWEIK